MAQRKQTPQAKVKISQAARKRQRKPKNAAGGGEFVGGIHKAKLPALFGSVVNMAQGDKRHFNQKSDPEDLEKFMAENHSAHRMSHSQAGMGQKVHWPGQSPEQFAKQRLQDYVDAEGGNVKQGSKRYRELTQMAMADTRGKFGPDVAPDPRKVFGGPIDVRNEKKEDIYHRDLGRVNRDDLWKTERGSVYGSPVPHGEIKEAKPQKGSRTPSKYLSEAAPGGEREWILSEIDRPGSPFYGAKNNQVPGAVRRLSSYTDLRQQGYSSNEILDHISVEKRGRKPKDSITENDDVYMTPREKDMLHEAKANVNRRLRPEATGRKDKFAEMKVSHKDYSGSIAVPGITSPERIRALHPDWSDVDIARFRAVERQTINEEMLQKNELWAHENRAERYVKAGTGNQEDANKVVVFTTNLGGPTLSVPSHSLIGQYVVKRRKKMVVDDKQATRYEVKGEFPRAVRDQHIIELSTGIAVGAQGRYGAFQNTGFKRGNKRSKGYGKQLPVGSQILRDAYNRPVYDKDGNIRYTEGYTRPFDATTPNVGLRIFIG